MERIAAITLGMFIGAVGLGIFGYLGTDDYTAHYEIELAKQRAHCLQMLQDCHTFYEEKITWTLNNQVLCIDNESVTLREVLWHLATIFENTDAAVVYSDDSLQ